MSKVKAIRDRLGLTQEALAKGMGCTQGNIGHYEINGQTVPPEAAKRLIAFALTKGVEVTYEDIYGPPVKRPKPSAANHPARRAGDRTAWKAGT